MDASVIIPLGENLQFLNMAVNSTIADIQGKNVEILLITHDPAAEKKLNIGNHPNVRFIHHKGTGSVASNLNVGIENAVGETIFRMDADDIWLPGRFEEQMKDLAANRTPISLGSVTHVNDTNVRIPQLRSLKEGTKFMSSTLLLGNSLVHPAIAFRKSWIESRRYEESIFEDWNFWITERAALHGILTTKRPVIRYRIHKNQVSRTRNVQKDDPIIQTWLQALNEDLKYTPNMSSPEDFFNRGNHGSITTELKNTLSDISKKLITNKDNYTQVLNLLQNYSPLMDVKLGLKNFPNPSFVFKALWREILI